MTDLVRCPRCDGFGFVTIDHEHGHECAWCDGNGRLPRRDRDTLSALRDANDRDIDQARGHR